MCIIHFFNLIYFLFNPNLGGIFGVHIEVELLPVCNSLEIC